MQKSSFFFFAATFAKLPLFSRIFLQKTPLSFTWNSCKSPLFSCNFPQTPNFRRDFCKTLTFFFLFAAAFAELPLPFTPNLCKSPFYFFFCGNLCKIPTFHCNFCKTAPLFSLFFFCIDFCKTPTFVCLFFCCEFCKTKQTRARQNETNPPLHFISFHCLFIHLFFCYNLCKTSA